MLNESDRRRLRAANGQAYNDWLERLEGGARDACLPPDAEPDASYAEVKVARRIRRWRFGLWFVSALVVAQLWIGYMVLWVPLPTLHPALAVPWLIGLLLLAAVNAVAVQALAGVLRRFPREANR